MRFSPSNAHRWLGGGCTGSVQAESAMNRVPTMPSPQADEGTRLHAVAADMLTTGDEDDCPPDDWSQIGAYVEDVRAAHELYGGELKIEHPIELAGFGRGKLDASLRTSSRVIIWELKTGHRTVEAVRNWQLIFSAILMDIPNGFTVELRIIQSNGYHLDGSVRTWTLNDLPRYRIQAQRAINEAKGFEPRLVATPSNCLYCKALTSCPAATDVTLGGMDRALGQVGPIAADAMQSRLVTLRNTAKLVKAQLTAMEAEAEARMKNGELIPGCTMAAGKKGSLKWTADDAKVRAVCNMFGHEAQITSLRTPAQMIDAGVPAQLVASVTKRGSPATSVSTDAKAELKKLFPS